MSRSRFLGLTALALALAVTVRTGRSEEQKSAGDSSAGLGLTSVIRSGIGGAAEHTCTIYALAELGVDSDLGNWIAETIPEVIEPGTWKGQEVLRYYAPKNILVVYHTPAVQAKVDGFLKNVKKSLPSVKAGKTTAKMSSSPQTIVQAGHHVPALLKTSSPVPEPSLGYAVPAPIKAPKHLFHFIIRYEGEGIIDDNVVKFMKAYYQAVKKEENANVLPGPPPPKIEGTGPTVPSAYGPPAPPSVSIIQTTATPEDKKGDKKADEDKGTSKKD
jgi:hypothetical protein